MFKALSVRTARLCALTAVLLLALPALFGAAAFNTPGNILIADQFNNRVIEVDPQSGTIVWQFGNGSSVPGPHSIVGVNDAERVLGNMTLMAGTGTPPGVATTCTNPNGCPDNRVFIVDSNGTIVWHYGQAGVTGSTPGLLNTPVFAAMLPNFDILITDQGNQRVIEVTLQHQIVWQYGTTGVSGIGINQLNNPNSAELLDNGNILIADENNNRAIEVTRNFQIVWECCDQLSGVAFASRLPNGDTLITDSNNNRIVEVNANKRLVWEYKRPEGLNLPTRAVRLKNGNTLISDQFNQQVIEVNPVKKIVFTYGQFGVPGNTPGLLYAPYDAKVIGDYTSLAVPPQ
jgi:outer membrane protein assembly factor BamB